MKRTLFLLTLLALLFTGFNTLQAQSSDAAANPAKSGMPVFEAYKMNFEAAVNLGNVNMADPHRIKMVRNFEREITNLEATHTATNAKKSEAFTADIARQKAIVETFKTMDLSTPAALEAAKSKLALIDEFAKLTAKNSPASTH
jgi:hypothetical protein